MLRGIAASDSEYRSPMRALTKANLRHLLLFLRLGRHPAATVYDSIGPDFFLAPAPGWLNLGLWEGDARTEDPLISVRRLVTRLAEALPKNGTILDVGNGLGAQDPVIAEVAQPRTLIAMNITRSQLVAGRSRLEEAGASAINADAARIPLASNSVDGVISVEAAFHFPSRRQFFAEVMRVLRPGGVLTMSDVGAERAPRSPGEIVAGLTNLRVWGLKARNMISADQIAALLRSTGFADVDMNRCTDRTLEPAIVFMRSRLEESKDAPWPHRLGARVLTDQWELLSRRGIIEYVLIEARKP